jgi:hypothetical protein
MRALISNAMGESPIPLHHNVDPSTSDYEAEADMDPLEYALLLTLERHADILNRMDEDENLSEAVRLFWQTRVL